MSFGQTNTSGATIQNMAGQGTPRMVYGRSYTPVTNENLTSIRIHARNNTGFTTTAPIIGIYDITSGRVGSLPVHTVTIPLPANTATMSWVSVSTSYTLQSGKTYSYAFVSNENTAWELSRQTTSSIIESHATVGDYTMPAVWASGGASTLDALIEVVTVPVGATITSTNSGSAVKNGSTFSSVVSLFTGIVSGTIGGKALSSLSYSANSITATAPSFVDGATFYEPDTNQTLTYVNGSETASATIPTASPNGMTSVVIVSPETVDNTYLTEAIAGIANPDRIVFPTESGNFSIAANGKITAATAGLRVLWWWKASNSMMTQLNVTINDAGAIVSVTTFIGSTIKGSLLAGSLLKGKLI